jgi:alcohol dehydrogenase (cytochrome c)
MVWYYQTTPGDQYDYDANWEVILPSSMLRAQAQGCDAAQPQRLPLCARPDRRKLISAKPFEKVNWAVRHRRDRAADRDRGREETARRRAGRAVADAARREELAARGVQSRDRLLYANTMHAARMFKHLEIKPFVVGQRYQFVENLPAKQPAGEPIAHMDAIDPLTAKQKWRAPIADHPHWSAMLSTGGGLLFTGR